MGISIQNLSPTGTIKVKSNLPTPPTPTEFEVIIVELIGKQNSNANACTINELELYNNTTKTTYNIADIDVYDYGNSGLPSYWNSSVWKKSYLNDGVANYSGYNATLFMFPGASTTSWVRMAVFPSNPANKIRIHCGSTGTNYYRLPIKVKVYGSTLQDYNKTVNIDNRQDTNLIFLGEKEYAIADSHQWFYIGSQG